MKSRLLGAVCAILFSLITMSANAALVGRLPTTPGGTDFQAAYDDVLDITWVTDAGISGSAPWENQLTWASDLDYLGFNDWRLPSLSVSTDVPTSTVVNCNTASEEDCRDNEMGYMFYQNMGGSSGDDKTGNQTVDGVLLTNINMLAYWSNTEANSTKSWAYIFGIGAETIGVRGSLYYGWAVADGDVFVPIPASIWLFGSGLLGLVGMARRKKVAMHRAM